ncbi:MAG TPA: M14 family zinc carboxypeptidase [Planctomycetota bacterium]
MRLHLDTALLSVLLSAVTAQAPAVTFGGETMRLRSATVAAAGSAFNVTLVMEDDNANASLGSSFRRWWHCQIANLNPAGVVLHISVTNAGYSDVILPVWAQSTNGTTFGSYARVPLGATPAVSGGGSVHNFTLAVPAGVVAIRLAKYFPYSVTRKNDFVASLTGLPQVRSVVSLGSSAQGRTIDKIELTDGTVPDAGKKRVWIQAGIHPAETTSYFMVEGFVEWLLSADPWAAVLLDRTLIELLPMVNPDGVFRGNYRTNVNSSNLESEWSAPYASTQPEIVALRTAIEGYMGSVASPGANPIRVLLNLHSSHNVTFPFHFQHTANPNWHPTTNNTGVIPAVNAVEGQWIAQFEARSPFVTLGTTQSSALVTRPFVESMCHDRWTAVNGWLGAPGLQAPVMAITFEGTYGKGPDGVTWNTEADYRLCGAQMGRALCDHLGLQLTASLQAYGAPCASDSLTGVLVPQPDGSHVANLQLAGAWPNAFGLVVLGGTQLALPLPPPWASCSLLCSPDATVGFFASAAGTAQLPLLVPPIPGLLAYLQCVTLDLSVPGLPLDASNGVRIRNDY